jgi:hypothetical protein
MNNAGVKWLFIGLGILLFLLEIVTNISSSMANRSGGG